MNFKQIEVFLKVIECKNLTYAAKNLNMTQPSVSNIIKRMEAELGVQLFIRQGKTLIPSVQGQILYEASQNQWVALQRAVNNVDLALADKHEIVVSTAVSSDWFFHTAGLFTVDHPEIRLVFQSEKYIPKNHRLSMAQFLLLSPYDVQDEQTLAVDYQNNLYVLLPKEHPFSQERLLSLSRLKHNDFVFVQREMGDYEQCYFDCLYSGFSPHISLTVNTKAAKYAAIRSGCGIGLVYDNELSLAESIRDCVTIPIRGGNVGKTIYLAWYDDYLTEWGREFLEYVRQKISLP